jgi:putative ABC transport system permease protein
MSTVRANIPNRPRRSAMFLRMLLRASLVRRGRALSALLAMAVAAAVATAMLNLYVDVQAKLHKEFRRYGANIVLVAKPDQALPQATLQQVQSLVSAHGIAVPFAYVVAHTASGSPVVIAGTNLEAVRQLDAWWSVSAWPTKSGEALVGTRAASAISTDSKRFALQFQGKNIALTPAGTLHTGADEDSRIYISLADFTAWTGLQPSTIEIAANGSSDEITTLMGQLASALPQVEVRPVRQIVEAEGRVLAKTRGALLSAVTLIILTAALCVLATLTAWVLDRRKDFAIMKALGASERLISGFFVLEAAFLGIIGGLLGFAIGLEVAAWIGRANFHASIKPRLSVFPSVLLGSIIVALLAASLPMALLRRVQPAVILRGE